MRASFLFHVTDASSSYKGGWSHATSPAPGQGKFLSLFLVHSNLTFYCYDRRFVLSDVWSGSW